MKALVEALVLILLAALAGTVTWAVHPEAPEADPLPPDPLRLTIEEVNALETDVIWLDARSREQFEAGHHPGATRLAPDAWQELLEQFFFEVYDDEATMIVYCDGGECRTSREVAERLRTELGTEQVFYLHNGWDALKDLTE